MCVNDFCLVNSVALGMTGFSITISMCVCQIDEECKKETERQTEGEESEGDKSSQGVLGGLGPSVAKTIHFHPSSVAHFIQMHIWCPTEPSQGSDTLSGVRLTDELTDTQRLETLFLQQERNRVEYIFKAAIIFQLFGLKISKYDEYNDHSFF